VKEGVVVPLKDIWNPNDRTPPAETPLEKNYITVHRIKCYFCFVNIVTKILITSMHVLKPFYLYILVLMSMNLLFNH
jgi:hypothetical protein